MKISSWNVNSLNVRKPQVLDYLSEFKADVLGLQELKQTDEAVDKQAFIDAGYHLATYGQKTYNGVALISRYPLEDIVLGFPDDDDPQARAIAATVNGVRLLNLYVPNGKAVGDEKYHYKLAWLDKLQAYVSAIRADYPHSVIIGDFNIAPSDIDTHDPKKWTDKILCSAPEREHFQRLLAQGYLDAFRHLHPNEQSFSWWDYRMGGLRRNLGLRIDLTLCSQALNINNADIEIEPRKWERPSDHTPVYVEISTP